VKDPKKFSRKAIDQIMEKKTLSAGHQRRSFARASAAKRFLITLIAPELLELRARHDALERMVLEFISMRPGAEEEALEERLEQFRKKALEDLPVNDKLKHIADQNVNKQVWRGVEDAMVRDIEQKQRKPLLDSAGVEEK